MGLDTTHDCWHGAYSAFMRWREMIAKVAGFPPLMAMEGFFDPEEWWCSPPGAGKLLYVRDRTETMDLTFSYALRRVFDNLPISWDRFESDPLTKLLYHSDCDGEIAAQDCGPIADRLQEILPKLPNSEAGGHIGNWKDKTSTFIAGLRKAAAADEPVRFH